MASPTIDQFSKFQQTGNLLALNPGGYNVVIFGVPLPGGAMAFDRRPMFRGADFPPSLGDLGATLLQADGTIAVQWPL